MASLDADADNLFGRKKRTKEPSQTASPYRAASAVSDGPAASAHSQDSTSNLRGPSIFASPPSHTSPPHRGTTLESVPSADQLGSELQFGAGLDDVVTTAAFSSLHKAVPRAQNANRFSIADVVTHNEEAEAAKERAGSATPPASNNQSSNALNADGNTPPRGASAASLDTEPALTTPIVLGRPAAGPLECVVGKAERIINPGTTTYSTYVEYPIITHTTLPSWPQPVIEVHRRFRDFVDLATWLQAQLPGCFLPQRPHRNAYETRKGSDQFLEQRRISLQRYLARLVAHPLARNSPVLQVFLQFDGELSGSTAWQALRPAAASSVLGATFKLAKQVAGTESITPTPKELQSANKDGNLVQLLREQMQALQGGVTSDHLPPFEQKLRDSATQQLAIKGYLEGLSTAMVAWVKRLDKAGQAGLDASKAFMEVADLNQLYGKSAYQHQHVTAQCLQRSAEMTIGCSAHMAKSQLTLIELAEAIPLAQVALAARERALLTSMTLNTALARKAGGQDTSDPKALHGSLAALKESAQAAADEYLKLAERNTQEMQAWQTNLQAELLQMVKEIAVVQVGANENIKRLWTSTAASINSTQDD